MKPLKIISILLILIFFGFETYGQDIHFSQYYNTPMFINPAFSSKKTGIVNIGLNYRNQGNSIGSPYKTYLASVSMNKEIRSSYSDWYGLGFIVFNDNAGDGQLKHFKSYLVSSYTKGLSKFGKLTGTFGFSAGFGNLSVDPAKLTFGNQWDGYRFNPDISSNEVFKTTSVYYFDLNAGFIMAYDISSEQNISAGVSLHHINQPALSFFDTGNKLKYKYTLQGKFSQSFERSAFETAIYYIHQQATSEFIMGINYFYLIEDVTWNIGLWHRLGRDIIPQIGLRWDEYTFNISYDINISELSNATNYKGAFEFSVGKMLRIRKWNPPCNEMSF